jgi:secondary thiamine-phosphate synthase enzyme
MPWIQKEIHISPKSRGFHIITSEVINQLPELKQISTGILHLFIKHTSASLTVNENADPDVRADMESFFNRSVPENAGYFLHTLEGSDDMTSHIKTSLLDSGLTIPVTNGRLNLGTWQGIYLCEHRNHAPARKLVLTLFGE